LLAFESLLAFFLNYHLKNKIIQEQIILDVLLKEPKKYKPKSFFN
jgi:hypothetical protein